MTTNSQKTFSRPPNSPQTTGSSVNIPVRPVTRKEFDDRRKSNKCFDCNERYFRGHQYGNRMYMLLCPDAVEEEMLESLESSTEELGNDSKAKENHSEELTLSLHAMLGTSGMHTLQLQGMVKKEKVLMLIDSGSTRNFIDLSLAKALGLELIPIKRVQVCVADGFKIDMQYVCKGVQWCVQGAKFSTDLLVMRIGGYGIVLGIQ